LKNEKGRFFPLKERLAKDFIKINKKGSKTHDRGKGGSLISTKQYSTSRDINGLPTYTMSLDYSKASGAMSPQNDSIDNNVRLSLPKINGCSPDTTKSPLSPLR
jgi:hypothetical protein